MPTLSTSAHPSWTAATPALAAAFAAVPVWAVAHETGTPHGPEAHFALYVGAAALLALAGGAIILMTRGRAERRVPVERRRPEHHRRR